MQNERRRRRLNNKIAEEVKKTSKQTRIETGIKKKLIIQEGRQISGRRKQKHKDRGNTNK